jgi:hypothetical protein
VGFLEELLAYGSELYEEEDEEVELKMPRPLMLAPPPLPLPLPNVRLLRRLATPEVLEEDDG